MTMKRLMTGMAMVLGALVYAAHGAGPAAAETFITVASTTSTQNSGLYDYILPRFTTKTGITVRVIAVGTGQAVRLARNGDADVLFVHDPVEGAEPQVAAQYAQAVANELRRLLSLPGGDPALVVDADLRPEGRSGPLVRTLESYAAYYAGWSEVWEAQALLRASLVVEGGLAIVILGLVAWLGTLSPPMSM